MKSDQERLWIKAEYWFIQPELFPRLRVDGTRTEPDFPDEYFHAMSAWLAIEDGCQRDEVLRRFFCRGQYMWPDSEHSSEDMIVTFYHPYRSFSAGDVLMIDGTPYLCEDFDWIPFR